MSPYWSYYEPAKPKEVKNGLKAKRTRMHRRNMVVQALGQDP